MKPENSNNEQARLHNVLEVWDVKEPLPPRFQERVWQRIARQEAPEPGRLWSGLFAWLSVSMARPSFAGAYLAVLLIAGLAAGYWQARVDNAQTAERLGERYVRMMDPYRMPR